MSTEIDYNLVEGKVRNAIRAIEAKPHVKFIRYLLIKRYSPRVIKQELFRLGLSAPHEPNLTAYYLTILDPIIKRMGLSGLYANHKNKLLRKGSGERYAKDILNYSIHLGDDLDGQTKFCLLIRELDIDILWMPEIYRFHGTAEKMPADENGKRILESGTATRSIEKILISPKRYLVDKLLLESVPDKRIVQYCREQYKMGIYEYDLQLYKKVFFNIKTHDIEDKIKSLEVEKNSLTTLLKDLDSGDMYSEMGMGEKIVTRKQAEQRIVELKDNIKTMNMLFSDFAFKTASLEGADFEKMFSDMVTRGYKRFCELDVYRDRDVVDPMLKVARLMTSAHDKLGSILEGKSFGDKHSQGNLMELYKKRTDDILSEQIARANKDLAEAGITPIEDDISPEDIAGIEDLGVSFDVREEED